MKLISEEPRLALKDMDKCNKFFIESQIFHRESTCTEIQIEMFLMWEYWPFPEKIAENVTEVPETFIIMPHLFPAFLNFQS